MTKITAIITLFLIQTQIAAAHSGHGATSVHSHGETAIAAIAAMTILFGLFHFYKKS